MVWWQKAKDGEAIDETKRGIEALGVPCLWRFFSIDCELCRKAKKFYDQGEDDLGAQFYAKKTPLALAILYSKHELLEEVNGKPVVIAIPREQVAGKIVERLKEGSWECDPSDPEKGFLVVVHKERPEGERFPKWYIKKGKHVPIPRDTLVKIYKQLEIVSPKQDKGAFLNWLYNKHPELVVVAGTDIPLNEEVALRFIPWPYWKDGEPVPEPEVDKDAAPIKILRFHWKMSTPAFDQLKNKGFDLSSSQEEDFVDEDVSITPSLEEI